MEEIDLDSLPEIGGTDDGDVDLDSLPEITDEPRPWEDGDGGSEKLPDGEHNQWGGNLRNEGRRVLLRRDKDGKVNGYSTTSSMLVRHDDGKFAVVPTVVGGKELSQEEAVKHYAETGEHWGMADDEESAQKMAQEVHDTHMKGNQAKWNDWLHEHWDEVSDDIRNDRGMAYEHEKRTAPDKTQIVSKEAVAAKGEMGITETAQKDYEAATGAEAPKNPILAQIANMGLTVGGRLNANLQMQAAQKLAAGGNYDDRDVDDLMDQMVYGGVKKVNDALETVPTVVGLGAEMTMFFHRKQRQKQERVPNEIMRDWDETEGRRYTAPDERRAARIEYARQIATDFIRERSAVRQNAETELKNREVTHTANVVSRGLGMLGYTAPYLLGPVGILAQLAEEGSANAVGYANDEYGYDGDGRFRIVAEGDDAGRAALAGFGTAGIETATEIVGGKIGGALAKRGAKTLGRLVVGNKAAEAIGAGVGKLAGKTAEALGKTKVGRKTLAFAKGVGSVFKWTSRKMHLENPIEENIEEFESQQANSLLGWDKRRSELENLTDENGKPIDGVGARWWHDTKQFLKPGEILKLNEAMLLTMGGGAAVAHFANRSARKYVDNIIRKHDLMSEEEINTASLEDKVNAYKAWAAKLNEDETARMIDEGTGVVDRLAERIAGSYGEKRKRVNALREKMAERDDYNNGIELDRLQIPRQKFNVPMRQDGRGRNVPDFRQVIVDNVETGETAQRNAVYDESGISIADNGGNGDAAYIVFSPDGRASRDFPTLTQAVKFATQLKNAYALDLARDRMKQQFIANEYDENYRGSKSEIVDVKGVEEAVRLGIKLTGEDVSKDANFRRDRRGWRLKDGTVVLVRDNIASPGEVQRLMRHEIVGHDGRMMQGRWFESDEGSEIGRLRDANLEKVQKDGPVTGRETRRVLRETVANVVQQRRHSADTIDKVVHAVRNALRNRGVDLKMNDTDLEVEVSRIEKELRRGDGDTHVSVDGTTEKQEFREAEQAETTAEERKENADETGDVRDEAPAQPEQGASEPAGGEAARPVEAQPQGGEAPRHGAVETAKTGSDAAEAPTEAPPPMKTDLGGAEGEDLFNRTQRQEPVAEKSAKPARPVQVAQATAPKAEVAEKPAPAMPTPETTTLIETEKERYIAFQGAHNAFDKVFREAKGDLSASSVQPFVEELKAVIAASPTKELQRRDKSLKRIDTGREDDSYHHVRQMIAEELKRRENSPVGAPKKTAATAHPKDVKPAGGRKSGDAAVLKENLTAETPAKPVDGDETSATHKPLDGYLAGKKPIEIPRIPQSAAKPAAPKPKAPKTPSVRRGERVLLKGTAEGQRVTFLKDNGDGTADVQVKTPGANRYMPEKVETRTVKVGDIGSSNIKDALSEEEYAALRKGIEGQGRAPSVRMKDEAAERKAKAALDAIDFNTPELDGLKSKIRNGTILTEADQRQFAEDIRKGRLRYPRFRADEISASTGKEHGKLWQYILSLESARMDGRRARGGSEVYGKAASQVRRGGSEWGRVGTGSAQSPSVAYSPKYRKLDSGTESEVFDTGDGWVVKVRQIHPLSIGDVIDELAKVVYHNYLFPGEKYVLDDIVRHEHDGYREFYLILRQPFVTPKTENGRIVQPTYAQIWQLMKSRPQGFTFMDLSSRPAETGEYGDYSSSDGDEGEVVPAVKKVAYNRQFVVYDFQPGRNTFIDAKTGKVRFIDPRIDINDPGAGFRYSKYGMRRKFDGEVDFDTPELGVREKQTALSGGTSRNQNPSGNEYGRKWKIFRPGTRNVDIGAGRFDKATQFLADIGVENIPFDPVNRDGETNRRAAESVRANPADTATVHNVLNVIDNDSVMEGIVNQAARAIKKNGSAIFTIYEGNRSGVGARTRDGYQRNAKARSYEPTIKKFFGSVETHGNVILARRPKDIGPAFWAFDSSFENGINFDTPEFDPERFGKLVTGVGKLVDVLVESGHRDFKSLATYIYERDAEKYGRAKPVLQDIWNAVARARGLSRVGDAEAERVFGIIEAQEKEADDENVRRGVRGEVLAGEPAAGGGGSVGLVAGQSAAGGGDGNAGGMLAGGRVRSENPDRRVDGERPGAVPRQPEGRADSGNAEVPQGRGGPGRETSAGNGSVGDSVRSRGSELQAGADRAGDGDNPKLRVKKAAKEAADSTKPNPSLRDFVMTRSVEDAILEKNAAQRVRNNLDAIKLIRDLKARDYAAMPEEQATLAKFVGWGGLREKVFGYALERAYDLERTGERDRAMSLLRRERVSQSAYDLHKELRSVLNDSEYESAKASASTAFYTPVDFVRVLHDALRNIGVKGGRFLGPSAGTGNFASAAGEYEKPVNWHFVEKDVMTGEMLKALFPNQRVTIGGFEETKFPDGFFDFAIDNVPYADVPISDRSLSSKMFKIHDYFFAKTLAKLRPGGVMAFLTSTGTLDKTSPILRQFLTEHGGKIVGAVRLPNGFFSENAGTDVASDLVVVQKVQVRPDNSAFEKGVEYGKTEEWVRRKGRIEKPLAYNGYFQNHPEQVIGTMEVASGQFGPTLKYTMPDGASMLEKVGNAVKNAFNGVDRDALLKSAAVAERQDHTPVYDKEGLRQGNVTMKDGKAFIKSGELLEPIALPNDRKLANEMKRRGRMPAGIMEGLLALRKAMRDVIDAQMSESDTVEADLAPLLANLNAVYDAFVQKNGTLHDKWISPFVMLDKADGNRMLALERVEKFKNGKTGKDESRIVKSDIFAKRVISRGQRATKADTPKDALVISYSETGAINVPRIAELLGVSGEEAVKKLKDGGDAFENPQTGLLEPSWVYLSGRVRTKLAAARAAVEAGEESFRTNVEALEKVQPPMVRLEDAEIKFGATWVDQECMKDFLRDAFGAENMRISLGRNEVTGQWNVEFGRVMNEDPWGETSWSPKEFVSRVLNHGSMNHYETDPSDKKRYLDERQTEANKLAAEKLHSAFSQFVQSSDKWAEPMYERYNAVMTDMVEIKLPNNVLPFRSAGMSEETLGKLFEGGDPNKPKNGREYQSAVIARGVLGGGSLCLAHCVGAGKTLEMQSIGVLGRHLGLFKKPMYVVPNHMLEQFTNEFVEAFPNANILKMAEADVKPANRRAFFAQVANGDWDAIVVKHSTFSKKLAMSDEYQKEFMEAQRKDLIEAIAAMREAGEKISVDQATKKLERLEAKLKKLANAENHDSQIVPFEELGVDQLFVDEAHNFKGMPITTRQGRTGGLSQGDSQRAEDMQMKTQYVQSLHGGDRGVVFATGTPLSNAPVVEAYVMLKYLAPNKLEEQGLKHFDDFVDAFGRITTESEFSTDGKTVKEKDKVSAFVNIPELMKLLRSAVDIVNSDQLDIPRPKPKYHMIDVDMSPAQEQIMEMVAREAAIPPTKEQRNKYLTLTRIAKNACLTPRLLGFEDGGNKIIRAVSEIKRVYDETTDNRGAQLVFTDIFNESEKTREMVDAYMAASDEKTRGVFESLARRGGKVGTYNLNEEIRDLLVAAGIPKEEIAIVQDIDKSKGDKDANKSALFAKVRSGEVRVLIGSRPKMGEGTNVQERLAAIHLLHPGWKPSEDEQAIGRIIRPGNTYKEGQIFYYLTKGNANIGSYETKNHQLIGVKSKLIDQVMHGDDSRREIDMDESAIDRDMLMGLASGNKALMELIDVKKRAHKLELNTESTLTSARRIKDKAEASGRILERKRGEFAQEQEGVKEWRDKNDGRPFALTTPDGRSVEKMKDMAELVSGEMTRLLTKDRYDRAERTVLDDFNGVELVLAFDRYGDEKFKLAVPLLGVEREINYSGFVPDFTTAAMTAFKGRILEAVSPDYAKAYENSLNDMDRQAKKMSADADKLQKDYEVMRGELIKLRTRQAQLEREVTPLVVQAVEDRKVAAYGNWLIAKPGGGQYVARRESDAKSLSAPTVKELIPLMDAEDFASPRNAATKTVDLRQRLKSDSKGETPMVSNIPVADVDFDTPELYTGSTADYERPSLHYVGTGEGSQVYGWGLYASNRRGVAESYAKAGVPRGRNLPFMRIISDNGTTRNGRGITLESVKEEAYADKNEYWSDKIAASTDNPIDARKDAKKYGREIEKYFNEHFHEYKFKYDSAPGSHLYEQTWFTDRAPGDESHLLKWYEPVSDEQRRWIEKAIRERFKTVDFHGQEMAMPEGKSNVSDDGVSLDLLLGKGAYAGAQISGGSLYAYMKKLLGSPRAASEFLARAGIDGVKYPANSYRGAVKNGDEAGWNYVSFRDDNVRVDHKWTDGEIQFDTPELSPEGRREYDAVVARYTNADGTKKPGWMKAPNGKPTKLMERQWVQVRTPSFKKWFGDWEGKAIADAILGDADIVVENGILDMPPKEQRAAAKALYNELKAGGPVVTMDGRSVRFTGVGFKEIKQHSADPHTLAIVPILRNVIATAHYFGEGDAVVENGNKLKYHLYAKRVNVGDGSMIARIVLREDVNGNVFYDEELSSVEDIREIADSATRKPNAEQKPQSPHAPHSIAEFFAGINPASVSKVVDENGEPCVVWHGSEKRFSEFSNKLIGSHTDANGHDGVGVWGRGHYFSDRKDLAEEYQRGNPDGQTIATFLDIRNPMPKEEVLRIANEALDYADPDGKNYYREYQRLIDESVRKNDYDGVMAKGKHATDYVAISPTQIKSATDNNGDFSGENADVNFDTPELSPAEQAYAESEDKTPTENVMREVYGMTNDEIATALKAAGMEPPKQVRKTDETAWMQAEELLSNPSYMAKLSSAVAKFPRNIADYENNALNVLFRRRQAEVNAAKEAADALKKTLDALNAIPKGERDADFGESLEAARREYGEAASRLAQAKALMHETGFALTRSSSEAGRRLRSNRGLIDQTDLSYAGISGRMATALGGADKITPEMDARIREIAKEFASIDEEGRDLATARLKAHAEKIVEQIKRGDKMRKATERKPGDEAKRVMRNYNDAMAQIEVGAAEVGGTLVGLPDQQYPAWGKWLRAIGEFHCFENPDITEEECVRAIVEDISPFMDGVDENQVRDALTGFGHNFRQSRYDAQRLMNDLRSQARLKRQMDWMDETNTMPPLTGMVRDEPSDTTRNLQKQVQERKKEIPDDGRDARRLKGVLESAKTRVKNRIADLERAIETGERIPGRDRTVPEDIELRELKKRRDALQQSYDELFKTERGLTDEQRVKLAERLLGRELEHALEDLDRARSGDFSKRPKRPGVESPSIDALRDRLDEVREQIRELKKAKYEFGMTPDELDAYNARKMANREKALMRLADRIVNGDLRPQKKPQPPMPPEMQKRYDTMGEQMKKARQKLADMRLEAEIATWPLFWRKAGEYLRFSMTAQRALRATMDFSAVLRQAARITLAHPVMGAKAFGKAWNAAHSEANLLAVNDEIMSDPSIQEAVAKYGLHLREVDATNARDVEMFHGMERDKVRIFGKEVSITDIPFFGEFMLKSERHYITYLNAVSAELYSSIVNDRTRFPAGPTAWQKKMVADMINIWNGSAALSEERRQALQKAWINDILWAPQLAISRIQSAALYDVWHPLVAKGVKNAETGAFDAVSAEERKTMFKIGAAEHLKSSLAMIALGALLKWLFADEDDWYDFKRADWFEKLLMIVSPKVGNTTIDLTGGEQSVNRAAHKIWKLATSGKVRTGSGRMAEMGSYGGPTVWGVIGRYVQGKTSPWLSELVSLMEGRDYVGNEYTWKDAAIGAAVPLTFEDVKEQLEQNGIGKSLITIPLSLLGAGGSTYDRKVYENAVNPFMEAKKTYDAVTDDGDLDESERRDKLSRLKASNPLLVDGIRDRIASETATIRRLEANARKVAAIAGEPNADLEAEIARRKADLLKLIRDNR